MDGLRACVHCGICLPQCPTYRVLGEEMDSPRGRVYLMRAAAEGRIALTPTMARHLDLCLGCRGVRDGVSVRRAFGQLLEATRGAVERAARRARRATGDPALPPRVFPHPARLGSMLHALRIYQRSGMQALVRGLGLLAPLREARARWRRCCRRVPAPAAPLPEYLPARGRARGRVGVLLGCAQRFFFADVNPDTMRLLSAAGWDVVVPRQQGCCGALHLHAGRVDDFRAMARRLMPAFDDVDVVVVNAAGCGSALKEYGHWLPEDAARLFAERVRDVSEVLADADLPLRPLAADRDLSRRLPSGPRPEGARRAPRAAAPHPGADRWSTCPTASSAAAARASTICSSPRWRASSAGAKATRIRETGARVVAAGNPGCLMQIRQHCRAAGPRARGRAPGDAAGPGPRGRRRAMKIRVRDHVKVAADKMAKIGLSGTARTQLDLYCVAPGQSQRPTATRARTRSTSCSRGAGASRWATRRSGSRRARRWWPRPASRTAWSTTAPRPAGAGAGGAAAAHIKRGPAASWPPGRPRS